MRAPFFIPGAIGSYLSRPFSSFAAYFARMFPDLGSSLKISGIETDDVEYVRLSILNAIAIGALSGLLFFLVSMRASPAEFVRVWGSLLAGIIMFIIFLSYALLYPFWILYRRAEEIDGNLLFAVRHLVVQTSAGVPLFDALSSASAGYGKVSEEFSRIVTEVNGGRDLAEALEESAEKSPSAYYRRIMWQVANSLGAGYATADILSDMMSYLTNDQGTRLRKFGSELNILSIFYLSTCIILPTLGLIFIIIMSSFSLLKPNMQMLLLIIFLVAVFNLVFLGMIKSRRPTGIL